jgi:aspartate/methionine/tyrosine aminotransferase
MVALLNDCRGLTCVAPQGTFFLLVSCTGTIGHHAPDGSKIKTNRDFAAYLLESADVAVLPGEDFGASPAILVSVAVPFATLEQAGQRLQRACAALSIAPATAPPAEKIAPVDAARRHSTVAEAPHLVGTGFSPR